MRGPPRPGPSQWQHGLSEGAGDVGHARVVAIVARPDQPETALPSLSVPRPIPFPVRRPPPYSRPPEGLAVFDHNGTAQGQMARKATADETAG